MCGITKAPSWAVGSAKFSSNYAQQIRLCPSSTFSGRGGEITLPHRELKLQVALHLEVHGKAPCLSTETWPLSYTLTESKWNQFLFALIDFRTLDQHLQKKSEFSANLQAHSLPVVQLTSLSFWMIFKFLKLLIQKWKTGLLFFFFPSKASDLTATVIVNLLTSHLIPLGLGVLICKMKESHLMSLPVILRFCLCSPPTSELLSSLSLE